MKAVAKHAVLLATAIFSIGCGGGSPTAKPTLPVPVTQQPPPSAPAIPTASLTANPNTVEKGQSTTLTWQTSNATDASIDGIGAVQPNGSQTVTPADSTTYTLTAKGAGGTQQATARVTVTLPPPPPPPVTPAKHYQITDLVPIPGAGNAQANAISHGHAAGYSVLADGTPRATLWHDGIAEDLGTGYANAINSSDQVVGYIQPGSLQGDFTPHASLWDHGIVTDLGTLPGFDSTVATGINDSGEVVGIAFSFANPQNQAGFKWTVQTGIQVISRAASALAINRHGDVAGIGLNLHATIFSTQRTIDLGTLGGDFSVAGSLNTQGHAAGFSPLTAGGPVHAFFFAGKGMQDLGTFGSGDNSLATGINDSDLVVGCDIVARAGGAVAHIAAHIVTDSGLWRVGGVTHLVGTSRPFVWSATSGMEDLNSLISDSGWSLATASGIDQTGEIVGAGVVSGPTGPVAVHGFMLIPEN